MKEISNFLNPKIWKLSEYPPEPDASITNILPKEILCKIFHLLGGTDLLSALAVCKKWNIEIKDSRYALYELFIHKVLADPDQQKRAIELLSNAKKKNNEVDLRLFAIAKISITNILNESLSKLSDQELEALHKSLSPEVKEMLESFMKVEKTIRSVIGMPSSWVPTVEQRISRICENSNQFERASRLAASLPVSASFKVEKMMGSMARDMTSAGYIWRAKELFEKYTFNSDRIDPLVKEISVDKLIHRAIDLREFALAISLYKRFNRSYLLTGCVRRLIIVYVQLGDLRTAKKLAENLTSKYLKKEKQERLKLIKALEKRDSNVAIPELSKNYDEQKQIEYDNYRSRLVKEDIPNI